MKIENETTFYKHDIRHLDPDLVHQRLANRSSSYNKILNACQIVQGQILGSRHELNQRRGHRQKVGL